MIPVIVDTREKKPWTFDAHDEISTIVAKLDTGDYSIEKMEDLVAIERKGSIEEFVGNVTQKRFWNEMDRLFEFKYKFLVLEFDAIDIEYYPQSSNIPKSKWKYLKVKAPFIMSCLSKIQVDYGVNVIFAGGATRAQLMVRNILKRIHKLEGFE